MCSRIWVQIKSAEISWQNIIVASWDRYVDFYEHIEARFISRYMIQSLSLQWFSFTKFLTMDQKQFQQNKGSRCSFNEVHKKKLITSRGPNLNDIVRHFFRVKLQNLVVDIEKNRHRSCHVEFESVNVTITVKKWRKCTRHGINFFLLWNVLVEKLKCEKCKKRAKRERRWIVVKR